MSNSVTDKPRHGYVLVTPAKNEAATLGETISSVVAQTVLPREWVIVSDGSTDRTDEIVSACSTVHPFLRLLRAPSPPTRSFSSKIRAFRLGYDGLQTPDYEFIGNLDADTRFQPDYYERLMQEMQENRQLGAASGVAYETVKGVFKRNISSLNHAIGPTMFFRRQCFEVVGGYHPVSVEGEDAIVERTARMLGWETRSFPELIVYHLRNCGAASGGRLRRCHRTGLTEYHIGNHPLWAMGRAIRSIPDPPVLVGALVRIFAYYRLWFRRAPRDASEALTAFMYHEQMCALGSKLRRLAGLKRRLKQWNSAGQ